MMRYVNRSVDLVFDKLVGLIISVSCPLIYTQQIKSLRSFLKKFIFLCSKNIFNESKVTVKTL